MADEKKEGSWLWPKIVDEASARDAAKAGALGGGLLTLGFVIGIVWVYLTKDASMFLQADLQTFYISNAVQFVLGAFLTWRLYSGNGRFASILLLAWLTLEVGFKVSLGQINGGWIIYWGAGFIALVNGVRGSWALHRFRKAGTSTS